MQRELNGRDKGKKENIQKDRKRKAVRDAEERERIDRYG